MLSMLITALLTYSLLTFAILQIFVFIVWGYFIPKNVELKYMNMVESDFRLNSVDPTILSMTKNGNFISKLPFRIFAKYYIWNLGIVPRWSKLHKKIDEYYKIANGKSK